MSIVRSIVFGIGGALSDQENGIFPKFLSNKIEDSEICSGRVVFLSECMGGGVPKEFC